MERNFWEDADEHHKKIARTFYENIERKSPPEVTSEGMCGCLKYVNECSWAATKVEYPEYTGPRVANI